MLSDALNSYSENLRALRDFVAFVAPVLLERREETADRTNECIAAYSFVLIKTFPELEQRIQPTEGLEALLRLDVEIVSAPEQGGALQVRGRDADAFFASLKRAESVMHPEDMQRALEQMRLTSRHVDLLNTSALISLTNAVEVFVSAMLHTYYGMSDGARFRKETVSLGDLEALEKVEDVREYVIDRIVESVLRGSLSDWLKHFNQPIGLEVERYLSSPRHQLTEVFQRRHIAVHNGGVVNAAYERNVDASLREGVLRGQLLLPDEEYLQQAIDICDQSFTVLCYGLWRQLERDSTARAEHILKTQYDQMLCGRWELAESIAAIGLDDPALSENRKAVSRINRWLSVKRQGRLESIRAEVQEADFTAMQPVYQMGRYAILDELDHVFKLLPRVLGAKDMNYQELAEWPLLEELRADRRFERLLRDRYELFEQQVSPARLDALKQQHGIKRIVRSKGKPKSGARKTR